MATIPPIDQEEPMSTLCRMVVDTTFHDLPSKVVDHAKRSILDTVAVIVGGSALEGIPAVVDMVKAKGGKVESVIPFYGGKVPASEAALAIGPMARAMDFGDIHDGVGHTSEYTVPALLAATGLTSKVSGKELITSYVVGQEVMIRIGLAYDAAAGVLAGTTGGHYVFGAVAAAGKLIGLTLEELENAEGIARGMTQPHDLAMYGPATLMVRVHHGLVCHDAIDACLLAKSGITGPRQEVLIGRRGYLALARWETHPEALTEGLGEKWEMLNTCPKPYTACKCTHTAISGLVGLMEEHAFKAEDIAGVQIDESSMNYGVACEPQAVKWHPQTVPECQFSVPYTVATAAYDGDVFLSSYTPEAMARQKVRALMARISVREDPRLPDFASRMHIALTDGRQYARECLFVKGHPDNPFTEQELAAKFEKCARYSACRLSDAVVASVIEALQNLEQVDDVVAAILLPLTPGQQASASHRFRVSSSGQTASCP